MTTEISGTPKNGQRLVAPEREPIGRATDQSPTRSLGSTHTPVTDDTVTLTDTAIKLRELSRRVAAEPLADTPRLDRIRQQLTDGTYEVNAARIADRLLLLDRGLSTQASE